MAADFSLFGPILSVPAKERKVSNVKTELGSQNKLFNALHESIQVWLDLVPVKVKMETDKDSD